MKKIVKKVIAVLLFGIVVCTCFVGCNNTSKVDDDTGKDNSATDSINSVVDDGMLKETTLDFENFYFEIDGVKFEKFHTFEKYLSLNPEPWEGYSLENVISSEGCNFKISKDEKYNDFSLVFYDDGTNKEDKDVMVCGVYVYTNDESHLDITFAQNIKLGDTAEDVLNAYGNPTTKYEKDGNIYMLTYKSENQWISMEFGFRDNKLSSFRVNYNYDA